MFSSKDQHSIFCQDTHFYSTPFPANLTNNLLIVHHNATNKGGPTDCCENLPITLQKTV